MGPQQQWRASERVDNRVADPCSMLDSTARLLPLSAFFQRAYLLGVAKRCVPILLYQIGSVPARRCRSLRYKKKRKPLYGLVCVEKTQGKDGGDNLLHGCCLKPADLEMKSFVSLSKKKNVCIPK